MNRQTLRTKAVKLKNEVKKLIFRKYPTEYHKRAWHQFEKICMYRSTLGQIEKLLNSLLLMALGKANFQRAEEYLAENEAEDNTSDMSASIFPYAKWITIVFTIGRLILILISIKHLRICKIYFYYEQILFLCFWRCHWV